MYKYPVKKKKKKFTANSTEQMEPRWTWQVVYYICDVCFILKFNTIARQIMCHVAKKNLRNNIHTLSFVQWSINGGHQTQIQRF